MCVWHGAGGGFIGLLTSFSVFSAGVTGTQDARPNDGDRLVLGPSTHCGAGRLLSRPIKGLFRRPLVKVIFF